MHKRVLQTMLAHRRQAAYLHLARKPTIKVIPYSTRN
ncbi:Dynein heavy chain (DYHC) (Fragment) (fragment) (fragment) [Xenorhabdus bovienii str. Jollieti]